MIPSMKSAENMAGLERPGCDASFGGLRETRGRRHSLPRASQPLNFEEAIRVSLHVENSRPLN